MTKPSEAMACAERIDHPDVHPPSIARLIARTLCLREREALETAVIIAVQHHRQPCDCRLCAALAALDAARAKLKETP